MTVRSVSELKRNIEGGTCYVSELPTFKIHLFWVDTCGIMQTVTEHDGSKPETIPVNQSVLRTCLKHGVTEIDCSEVQ